MVWFFAILQGCRTVLVCWRILSWNEDSRENKPAIAREGTDNPCPLGGHPTDGPPIQDEDRGVVQMSQEQWDRYSTSMLVFEFVFAVLPQVSPKQSVSTWNSPSTCYTGANPNQGPLPPVRVEFAPPALDFVFNIVKGILRMTLSYSVSGWKLCWQDEKKCIYLNLSSKEYPKQGNQREEDVHLSLWKQSYFPDSLEK